MSLFQCEICGCVENTACSSQGCNRSFVEYFDWSGMEDQIGKLHCSACAPRKYADGEDTGYGKWHNRFKRDFLPLGIAHTADNGNLALKSDPNAKVSDYYIFPKDEVVLLIAKQIAHNPHEQSILTSAYEHGDVTFREQLLSLISEHTLNTYAANLRANPLCEYEDDSLV